jgi:hypothetical protein
MARICLDRLLKQRSALRKPCIPPDFPPQRGGNEGNEDQFSPHITPFVLLVTFCSIF